MYNNIDLYLIHIHTQKQSNKRKENHYSSFNIVIVEQVSLQDV